MFSLLLPITTVRRPLHTLESNDRGDLGESGEKMVGGWMGGTCLALWLM